MSKNPLEGLPGTLGNSLGDYLREQRVLAKLSVRQLSALAGISNPYLSQIERGVKRPSAEILQQIAKGLSISAESLYVQAGLLDPKDAGAEAGHATRAAIGADPALTSRQRQTLLDIYESFVDEAGDEAKPSSATRASSATKGAAPQKAASTKTVAKKGTTKKATTKKTSASTKKTQKKAAPATKAAQKKTTAGTRAPRGRTSAASTKGSARTPGSQKAPASRSARSTTSSSTSTTRRST